MYVNGGTLINALGVVLHVGKKSTTSFGCGGNNVLVVCVLRERERETEREREREKYIYIYVYSTLFFLELLRRSWLGGGGPAARCYSSSWQSCCNRMFDRFERYQPAYRSEQRLQDSASL